MKRALVVAALLLSSSSAFAVNKLNWFYPDWQAATTYAGGTIIKPSGSSMTFMATDGGLSAGSAPTWCTLPGCGVAEGNFDYWNQFNPEQRVYCPNGATVPQFCTPSGAVGANSLTFSPVLFSTAASGATINIYAAGSTTPLTNGTLVTACTSCSVTVPNVVLPVVAGAKASYTVRATVTEAAVVTGIADTSFIVDYRSPNSGLIVGFTFDDTFKEQYDFVAPLLERYGFRGTFYANSKRLLGQIKGGTAFAYGQGYYTVAQAIDLQNRGHEIGIHTLSHVDLPCLGPTDQQNELGNDLVTLRNLGLLVSSAAYPYGANEIPQTWAVDQFLQLRSARDIGGLNNARGYCGTTASAASKPYANTLPPKIPYDFTAEPSLQFPCTLQDLQNYVTDAEAHGGGYLVFNFHHVCDIINGGAGGTCDPAIYPSPTLSFDKTAFANFIPWLAAHNVATGTTVARVEDVMGGSLGPVITQPVGSGVAGGSVANGDMEDYSNNGAACITGYPVVPDCFLETTTGSSNAVKTWSISDGGAFSGQFSIDLNITSATQGTVRLLTSTQPNPAPIIQDPLCPFTLAAPGTLNTFSMKYQSNTTIDFVVYAYTPLPTPNGQWVLIKSLNALAASPGVWATAQWQTPVSGVGSIPPCPGYGDGSKCPISWGVSVSVTGASDTKFDFASVSTP